MSEERVETLICAIQVENPAQELNQALASRCPFRAGYIEESDLKHLSDYYEGIFDHLKYRYNIQVLKQSHLANRAEHPIGPLPEKMSKIVRFYSKTQEENRDAIAYEIQITVLKSQKFRSVEVLEPISFLYAAAQLPELV